MGDEIQTFQEPKSVPHRKVNDGHEKTACRSIGMLYQKIRNSETGRQDRACNFASPGISLLRTRMTSARA